MNTLIIFLLQFIIGFLIFIACLQIILIIPNPLIKYFIFFIGGELTVGLNLLLLKKS